jgi:hypothetical protein
VRKTKEKNGKLQKKSERERESEMEDDLVELWRQSEWAVQMNNPDALSKIHHHRAVLLRSKMAVEAQVTTIVQSRVDLARNGLLQLSESFQGIENTKKHFASLNDLWRENQNLIRASTAIKAVSTTRKNLTAALRDLEAAMRLIDDVESAQIALQSNAPLLETQALVHRLEKQ